MMDVLVMEEYGLDISHLPPEDVRRRFLHERSFESKLEFLVQMETIDKESEKKIRVLQDRRNKLFHKDGHLMIQVGSDALKMKEEIINNSRDALGALSLATAIRFNTRVAAFQPDFIFTKNGKVPRPDSKN